MNKKIFLVLLVSLLIGGCNQSEESVYDFLYKDLDYIRQLKEIQKDLSITYSLGMEIEINGNKFTYLNYTIENKGYSTLSYVCQSANGLDYYLVLRPMSFKVSPFITANATFPVTRQLKPDTTYTFKTQIRSSLTLDDSLEYIGVDLRVLTRGKTEEELYALPMAFYKGVEEEYNSPFIIWSKNKN